MHESYFKTVAKRFCKHKVGLICLIIIFLIIIIALLAPVIAPYNPNQIGTDFGKGPSKAHLLGTDLVGRDVLSRVLYGTRISLLVAFLATFMATVIGIVLGLLSGYYGGWVDMVIMRFTDMIMSFPYILLIIVASAVFKPGLWNIIVILGLVVWPGAARLVRGNVLDIRQQNFVRGSELAGMSKRYILFSDILPNVIAPVLIFSTNVLGLSILTEASLSFLGMGVQPPTASLGNMINDAQSLSVMQNMGWLWIPPGLIIIILAVSINFVGDALRDALDATSTSQSK